MEDFKDTFKVKIEDVIVNLNCPKDFEYDSWWDKKQLKSADKESKKSKKSKVTNEKSSTTWSYDGKKYTREKAIIGLLKNIDSIWTALDKTEDLRKEKEQFKFSGYVKCTTNILEGFEKGKIYRYKNGIIENDRLIPGYVDTHETKLFETVTLKELLTSGTFCKSHEYGWLVVCNDFLIGRNASLKISDYNDDLQLTFNDSCGEGLEYIEKIVEASNFSEAEHSPKIIWVR